MDVRYISLAQCWTVSTTFTHYLFIENRMEVKSITQESQFPIISRVSELSGECVSHLWGVANDIPNVAASAATPLGVCFSAL